MDKLEPCPWCAAGEFRFRDSGQIFLGTKGYSEPTSVEIIHHCPEIKGQPSRPVIRVGKDRNSAIIAWNTRATAPK